MGSFKAILGFFVIFAAIYCGWLLIPPYFADYQFQDAIKGEALHSTYSTRSEDDIRDTIFKIATDMEIPVSKDQIKVHRVGTSGNGSLNIEVDYTVHVNLPGYPLDLHFTPSSDNRGIY
ncbi:MAG: hypothetical protein JST79_07545 [Acidobacteria bacterium]|jgi:hypothetical protein|nr:hypothetical protein [Acidobacteriota bacterium]